MDITSGCVMISRRITMRLLEKSARRTGTVIYLLLLSSVVFLSFSQVLGESFPPTCEINSLDTCPNPPSVSKEPESEMIWRGIITFSRYTDINRLGSAGRCYRKINCDFNIDSRLHAHQDTRDSAIIRLVGDSVSLFTLSADLINERIEDASGKFLFRRKIPEFTSTIISVYNPYQEFNDGVELTINKDSMTYELVISLSLSFQKKGDMTFQFFDSSIGEPYDLKIEIKKVFVGKIDGEVITGSWTAPECRMDSMDDCWAPPSKTPDIFGGEECGSTWNWNFRRIE